MLPHYMASGAFIIQKSCPSVSVCRAKLFDHLLTFDYLFDKHFLTISLIIFLTSVSFRIGLPSILVFEELTETDFSQRGRNREEKTESFSKGPTLIRKSPQ